MDRVKKNHSKKYSASFPRCKNEMSSKQKKTTTIPIRMDSVLFYCIYIFGVSVTFTHPYFFSLMTEKWQQGVVHRSLLDALNVQSITRATWDIFQSILAKVFVKHTLGNKRADVFTSERKKVWRTKRFWFDRHRHETSGEKSRTREVYRWTDRVRFTNDFLMDFWELSQTIKHRTCWMAMSLPTMNTVYTYQKYIALFKD